MASGDHVLDVMADKKKQIQTIITQFIIHKNHIVIGDIVGFNSKVVSCDIKVILLNAEVCTQCRVH
jgi:hypothetical protein